jgi:hypothetical protein
MNNRMPENPTTVQLENREAYPIVPLTITDSVMFGYGKTMQYQVDRLNLTDVIEEGVEAKEMVNSASTSAITEVEMEGYEYRVDIDSLSGKVETLNEQAFPLEINYEIIPDLENLINHITIDVCDIPGRAPVLNEMYVEKYVNNVNVGKIYNPFKYQTHVEITDNIVGMKEELIFFASTENTEATNKSERYLCFYGANESEEINSTSELELDRILIGEEKIKLNIQTKLGDYLWIILPNYLYISITQQIGTQVTWNPPVTLKVDGLGTYKAYRSVNALDEFEWKVIIGKI